MSTGATQKALKALIKSIPSEQSGVFGYPIIWEAYDAGRSTMAGKILAWVKKKVCPGPPFDCCGVIVWQVYCQMPMRSYREVDKYLGSFPWYDQDQLHSMSVHAEA